MYDYLILISFFAVIPSITLLFILKDRINLKNLVISLIVLFIIGLIWDQISVRLGIWSFSDEKIIGNLFGIPVEEYIFFIFVPLLVITGTPVIQSW
ncbi:MAG: lycopene cyclase domain-containing protein [Candidatus Thermoplasmatota archaeon]|nr:lycopene cyclase domain-containing protein [Candidatus Thermoplasmatota archaeon]